MYDNSFWKFVSTIGLNHSVLTSTSTTHFGSFILTLLPPSLRRTLARISRRYRGVRSRFSTFRFEERVRSDRNTKSPTCNIGKLLLLVTFARGIKEIMPPHRHIMPPQGFQFLLSHLSEQFYNPNYAALHLLTIISPRNIGVLDMLGTRWGEQIYLYNLQE